MNRLFILSALLIMQSVYLNLIVSAQEQQENNQAPQVRHIVIKNDNARFIGVILHEDAREVLILTENLGEVAIPKHEIREIRELKPGELRDGIFIGEEMFATRYFLTTNGLPIKKGDNYIQWNLFGPDFQFGLADNFGIGVMTTWIAMPVVGTAKYSKNLGEKTNLAIGGLLGTGSWANPGFGLMLPFGAITYGDRFHNINLSVGYGGLFYTEEVYNPNTDRSVTNKHREGRFLFSIAGMTKLNAAISLVFDSFFMTSGPHRTTTEWEYDYMNDRYVEISTRKRSSGLIVLVPGIRWQTKPDSAFQFGFAGARFEGEFEPVPLPMVQWYRKL